MTVDPYPPEPGIDPADMIRAVTLSCPDVAAMSSTTRTYLPGRTVVGVTADPHRVTVRIVARYGTPLPEITQRLGNLLAPVLAGRNLHVHVDDVVLPGDTAPITDDSPDSVPASPAAVGG